MVAVPSPLSTKVAQPGSPLAAIDGPSKLTPGPTGSWPLKYAELVQPVLDRHCVRCHSPEGTAKAPAFDLTPANSYRNLISYAEDDIKKTIDGFADIGCSVCLPHQATTDALLDRRDRKIRDMDRYAAWIRERGMIPGLSTHMPESIIYADETELDVGTYIQIYNAAGFLMQVEIDWIHRVIWNAKKPVITIKPLAAGKLLPVVGLAFVWSTLRDQDLVTIGTTTPDEAREVIEISRHLLERRLPENELQTTRSKNSLK